MAPASAPMLDNQYQFFRDLDRSCVSGGLDHEACARAVRMKRASIESDRFRDNPVVRDLLAGTTTLVREYDAYSRSFRGVRRFLPVAHDPAGNERLRHLAAILPNVGHFTRRSRLAFDNPVGGACYGLLAALAVGLIWARGARDDVDELAGAATADDVLVVLGLLGAVAGFVAGAFSMFKYRTRDPHVIHAREAAGYMDINYAYHRMNDDAAWAGFIRSQGGGAVVVPARHKSTR